MALVGVATAADLTPVASFSDYNITSPSVISFSNTDTGWASFDGKINAATGFTLQITMTNWTAAGGVLFYLSTKDTGVTASSNGSHIAAVGYAESTIGYINWYGATLYSHTGTMNSNAPTGGGGNVYYSYQSSDRTELPSHADSIPLEATLFVTSYNGIVTLYEVDNNSQLVKICETRNLSEGVAQSIVFSEWAKENGEYNTFNNRGTIGITAYSGALTTEQMSSLIVPEPTTATLSFLALAGLAARRRRK